MNDTGYVWQNTRHAAGTLPNLNTIHTAGHQASVVTSNEPYSQSMEDHSLLTGSEIVLRWLSMRIFLVVFSKENSDSKYFIIKFNYYQTISEAARSERPSCGVLPDMAQCR